MVCYFAHHLPLGHALCASRPEYAFFTMEDRVQPRIPEAFKRRFAGVLSGVLFRINFLSIPLRSIIYVVSSPRGRGPRSQGMPRKQLWRNGKDDSLPRSLKGIADPMPLVNGDR